MNKRTSFDTLSLGPDLLLPQPVDIPHWASLQPLVQTGGPGRDPTKEHKDPHPDLGHIHDASQDYLVANYELKPLSTRLSESDPNECLPDAPTAQSKSLENDLWQADLSLRSPPDTGCLHSWSTFHSTKTTIGRVRPPQFLSEAGSCAFDAALEQFSRDDTRFYQAGRIIETSTMIRSLWQLGLGRPSLLFPLANNGYFQSAISDSRLMGLSLEGVSDVVDRFLSLGNTVRCLRKFAERAYVASAAHAAEIAIARAVRSVLDAVEEHIIEQKTALLSIVSLDAVFEGPRIALSTINDLVNAVTNVETPTSPTVSGKLPTLIDIHLFETVFDFALNHMDQGSVVAEICRGTLDGVAKPWLKAFTEQTQVYQPLYQDSADDSMGTSQWTQLPQFLSHKDRYMYQKVKQARSYVIDDFPECSESALQFSSVTPPELEWCFDWTIADRVESKCKQYEQNLIMAIGKHSNFSTQADPSTLETEPKVYAVDSSSERPHLLHDHDFPDSISILNGPVSHLSQRSSDTFKDRLTIVLDKLPNTRDLDTSEVTPPLSMTPSLTVSPLLRIQCRILSHVTLHSILHTHDLRGHVDVHQSFSLFGSGLFSARLADVLFSSELEPAERCHGIYRKKSSLGLRLGGKRRKQWPPASSELQLVLMDVLNDCWDAEEPVHPRSRLQESRCTTQEATLKSSLPGELFFAIRSIPTEDIPSILNPHSIHALDFLRLSGNPSPAIEKVFTAQSRDSYDRCFAVLLRLLRVQFVVRNQIPQDLRFLYRLLKDERTCGGALAQNLIEGDLAVLHRTQHTAHYFISTISSHFMLTVISKPMSAFKKYLDELATIVRSPVPNTSIENSKVAPSLADLAAEHEHTTTAIAAGLFAERRQRKVADALSKCLEDVLIQSQFVRACVERLSVSKSQQGCGEDLDPTQSLPSPQDGYEAFTNHIKAFVAECEATVPDLPTIRYGKDDKDIESVTELLTRLKSDWKAWCPNHAT